MGSTCSENVVGLLTGRRLKATATFAEERQHAHIIKNRDTREIKMFNFLVSGNEDSWTGDPYMTFDMSRSVREYTDPEITKKYGDLDADSISALLQLPTIFAYEQPLLKDPKFGRLTAIEKRKNRQEVRLEYELHSLPRFLTNEELWSMGPELDLGKWEPTRTHWAVKAVDLGKELWRRGIALPSAFSASALAPVAAIPTTVDLTTHVFDAAFSFPGEYRPTVEAVVREATALLGTHACFYDNDFQAQLARPSLDTLLQDIYGKRARLLVVFVGADYQRKKWPNIEWHAIRALLAAREHARIMYVRMDDGEVDGVFPHDGFIDARRFNPSQIAAFIAQRVSLLPSLNGAFPAE